MQVAELERPVESTDVRFINFDIISGEFLGTLEDGRVVEVESIHYRGDLGETHITYYDDGEARVAVRRREPLKERIY